MLIKRWHGQYRLVLRADVAHSTVHQRDRTRRTLGDNVSGLGVAGKVGQRRKPPAGDPGGRQTVDSCFPVDFGKGRGDQRIKRVHGGNAGDVGGVGRVIREVGPPRTRVPKRPPFAVVLDRQRRTCAPSAHVKAPYGAMEGVGEAQGAAAPCHHNGTAKRARSSSPPSCGTGKTSTGPAIPCPGARVERLKDGREGILARRNITDRNADGPRPRVCH